MDYLLVRDKNNRFEEILIDIDYSSFKYEYEKNTTRTISFTAIRTPFNSFSFDMLVNEAIITFQGQEYIVKVPPPKVIGNVYTKDIQAYHISYGVQDYVNYNKNEGERSYTLKQAMDFAMKGNNLGYSYKLVGSFPTVKLTDLGGKNALSMITDFLEAFGAIMLANNKQIILYTEDQFYIQTEKTYYHLYNTEEVSVVPDTTNLKTIGKAYGRLRDDAEYYSGDDRYTAVVTYTSPNAAVDKYGPKMADEMQNDDIDNEKDLLAWLKSQLQDEPELSIELTYTGNEDITERDIWYFKHEPLQFDTNVKVNRLTKYHPWSNQPFEVGFSNAKKDMVKISRQIAKQAANATKAVKTTKLDVVTAKTTANKAYESRLITEYVKEIPKSADQEMISRHAVSTSLEWIKSPATKENMYAMTHIEGVEGLSENYVAKEAGKVLSTNDYSAEDKARVQKISDTSYYINDAITGKPMMITVENGVIKAKEVIQQ